MHYMKVNQMRINSAHLRTLTIFWAVLAFHQLYATCVCSSFENITNMRPFIEKYCEFLTPQYADSYAIFNLYNDTYVGAKYFYRNERHSVGVAANIRAYAWLGAYNQFQYPIKLGLGEIEGSAVCYKPSPFNFFLRSLKASVSVSEDTFKFTAGLFAHDIGCGITLGDAHRLLYVTPMTWQRFYVDQFRPGIRATLIAPEFMKSQLYLGLLASYSDKFSNNYSYVRAQELLSTNPQLGAGCRNAIITISTTIKPYKNNSVQLYFLARSDHAALVEVPHDSTLSLGTAGLIFKGEHRNAGLYVEGAFQRGVQRLCALDRNRFQSIGFIQQNHLFMMDRPETYYSWQSAPYQTFPEDLGRKKAAGEIFRCKKYKRGLLFKNSYNRFRNAYDNYLRGRFVYAEAFVHDSYFDSCRIAIAAGGGYISGDAPANDSNESILINRMNPKAPRCDFSKKFHGFVGTEQLFHSENLTAYFLNSSQALQRDPIVFYPLHASPAVTNKMFAGIGLRGTRLYQSDFLEFGVCAWCYALAHKISCGYSYPISILYEMNSNAQRTSDDYLNAIIACAKRCPHRFLGSEVNGKVKWIHRDELDVFANVAFFFPGTWYNNAVGTFVPLHVQNQLAARDFSGIELAKNKYTPHLHKPNVALVFQVGLTFKF